MTRRYFVLISLFLLLFTGILTAHEAMEEKKFPREAIKDKVKKNTYECRHCGLMMQVKGPDEKCDVCRCGKAAFECKGE